MQCNGCGNPQAYRSAIFDIKDEHGQTVTLEICDRCGNAPSASVPDVYWDGQPEINLADDPQTGKARVFSSKGEKARYLKERGIYEAGDTYHGAPFSGTQERTVDNKPEIRKAINWAKGLGIDRRREELRKILKQSEQIGRERNG